MNDRRITPDPALVDGMQPAQIASPHADLLARPNGPRDRQLLHGDFVTVLGHQSGHSYVRSDKDNYIGFVPSDQLATRTIPTHVLTAPAGHAYKDPNIKSPETASLSFGARLTAISETPGFIETSIGFVPQAQIQSVPYTANAQDTAQLFVGTPYLWGGNTRAGIDCSGLIQIALLTAGRPCPGDSDLQHAAFDEIDPEDRGQGDLVFWKGHVAMLLDPHTIIHANAHHMAVTVEPLAKAITRISKQEFGEVTGYARP